VKKNKEINKTFLQKQKTKNKEVWLVASHLSSQLQRRYTSGSITIQGYLVTNWARHDGSQEQLPWQQTLVTIPTKEADIVQKDNYPSLSMAKFKASILKITKVIIKKVEQE
jgi:hypothetical protein